MKGTKFNFCNIAYEIYSTTEGMYHCVKLLKSGKKASPNVKTLRNFKVSEFNLGLRLGAITVA